MKQWFLIIGLIFSLIGVAAAQDFEASAKVQDEHVSVGKPFTLDLALKAPRDSVVEWNSAVTDILSSRFDVLDRGELQRSIDADSNIVMQQQLTLVTFDTGDVQIPNLQLSTLHSPLSTVTDSIMLHASTIAVDTTQAYHPIAPPIKHPVKMREVLPWILIALFLIVVGVGVWCYVKFFKKKPNGPVAPVRRRTIPPYDKALIDLKSLRDQKLWQTGKVKEYYSGLSDITREYIEGQFHVNAVEMTTDEILQEMMKLKFDKQIYDKLKDAMDLSDLVKFAKYSASELENDNAMDEVEGFVKESYLYLQAEKEKEEKGGSAS